MIINESISYDPFKKDMKKDNNGPWTDGWGHSFTIGRKQSDPIKYKNHTYVYEYDNGILRVEDANLEDREPYLTLNVGDWLDNPEYWLDKIDRMIK